MARAPFPRELMAPSGTAFAGRSATSTSAQAPTTTAGSGGKQISARARRLLRARPARMFGVDGRQAACRGRCFCARGWSGREGCRRGSSAIGSSHERYRRPRGPLFLEYHSPRAPARLRCAPSAFRACPCGSRPRTTSPAAHSCRFDGGHDRWKARDLQARRTLFLPSTPPPPPPSPPSAISSLAAATAFFMPEPLPPGAT